MRGVAIPTRFRSNLKHHLGVGKSLQFGKAVLRWKLGNTGSGVSMRFIPLQAEKKAIKMLVTQDSGEE